MKLRNWQSNCIGLALHKYQSGEDNFFAVATPGAGKTTMASVLAAELLKSNLVDLILCLTPTQATKNSFAEDLAHHTGRSMNGSIGSHGIVLTYQSLGFLEEDFWSLFSKYRIFVIFDEIHHCGGDTSILGNAWGEIILDKISDRAQFTLSISGTPWRSDKLPVALARYSNNTGILESDYIYGLQEAIRDKVCRIPRIIAIDNSGISVTRNSENSESRYKSIRDFLNAEKLPLQLLLNNPDIQEDILGRAISKLSRIREFDCNAAGLIVASSVAHAVSIRKILEETYAVPSVLITHKTPNANNVLENFKNSSDQWVISVGMISEGTNVPRLQVCCHLSRIKTELHFRQVLGRILRVTPNNYPYAYMFIVAEPKLLEFANRVQDDLPCEAAVVNVLNPREVRLSSGQTKECIDSSDLIDSRVHSSRVDSHPGISLDEITPTSIPSLIKIDDFQRQCETGISVFGSFMEELISMKSIFDEG
ncbi:DEAD/DEAH box helicase [Microbulbifer pacificus]|uniref:DEAD/DEAH box helicase family protein n=1 Tax=Microbulbifer pacificus TaxID=407164 RepID=A0AAU0N3B4_9GAMM|nr:DEAD/DEAH box helicase family protein [Microbulbifer pacificus]WOX06993.1 DEAD/DEAH box helicase family protein [Microbulbifer pacificus]